MKFLLFIIIVLIVIFFYCIRIVPQAHAYVIEFLGTYKTTWGAGLHFLVPVFDKIVKKISLKEQVLDFPPQSVITKDNVTMKIDTVIYLSIFDPKLFSYGVENPLMAIENLTATTLRNVIGELELDQTLTSREIINERMREEIDTATDAWGIKITRVELKNIIPPAAIQEAMEKQMKAERERRESILQAEGKKKSMVLVAEGNKESALLNAQAEKEAAILKAEAEKQAAILAAEAEKEKMIKEAEGQADAIMRVSKAQAEGLALIKQANIDDKVIQLKSLEALEKVADGNATKIIIPSNLQSSIGTITALSESISK